MQTFSPNNADAVTNQEWRAPTHKISEPGNKISEASISERHGSWVYAPIACAVDLGFALSRFSVRVMGA